MESVTLAGLTLSPIALGTALFGGRVERNTAFAVLDAYRDRGGNLLDTAAVYGPSEATLGEWLASRGARGETVIATKGGHPSLPDFSSRLTESLVRGDMEASLRALRTDCVDIYYLHRDDERLPVEAIMPMLDRLVREGKTRLLGASNWRAARIREANAFSRTNGLHGFSVSQILWNAASVNRDKLYDKTLVAMDNTEYEGYREMGMPIMAYTSQAGGLFSRLAAGGWESLPPDMAATYGNPTTRARAEAILRAARETGYSPTALGLSCLLRDPAVPALPIIGASSVERLEESLTALTVPAAVTDNIQAAR